MKLELGEECLRHGFTGFEPHQNSTEAEKAKRIQGRGPEPRDGSTSRGMGLEPSVDVSFTSGRVSRRQQPDLALLVLQILITPSIY